MEVTAAPAFPPTLSPRNRVRALGQWLWATDESPISAFKGVRWSISFAALLVYLFVIVTYEVRIGDAAMGAALIGLLFEPRGLRFPVFVGVFFAMALWVSVSGLSSPWPGLVAEKLEVVWKLGLITLVAVTVLNDRPRIRLFIILFLLFYAAFPARGTLFNYFLGGYTVVGRAVWNFIYRNPNDLAALTLLQLSMAAGLMVTERARLYRLSALAAVLVLCLIVLLTQSRGAFLGLGVFGLLALARHRRKSQAVVLLVTIGVGSLLILPDQAFERFGMLKSMVGGTEVLETLDDKGSAAQRWDIWNTSFRIIKDNPVFGVGIGTYGQANALYSPRLGTRDTHSTYFNLLAETGVPGLLLFLAMMAAVVVTAERVRRRLKNVRPRSAQQIYLMELGLLAYLIAGVFASYARLTFLYVHLVLIWSLAMAHERELRALRAGARRAN